MTLRDLLRELGASIVAVDSDGLFLRRDAGDMTPEMIEAGIAAHAEWAETLGSVGELVERIYRAMRAKEPGRKK